MKQTVLDAFNEIKQLQIITMPACNSPMHVQYRNGTYYGIFQNYQRNGTGLLVLDNSHIILGQWRRNVIHGKFIFITDTLRAYGTMLNGKLDGYNIITVAPSRHIDHKSKSKEEVHRAVYANYRQDKVYGKGVLIDNDVVMINHFVSNELKEAVSKQQIKDREVYDALSEVFPKNMYTLEEFLISFMKEAAAEISQAEEIPRYEAVVIQYDQYKFFGYEEIYSTGRKFGFLMRSNQLISVGEHFKAHLEGIGRHYIDHGLEDGIFNQGQLKGIGIRYFTQTNKYTIGQHDGKNPIEKGLGFPNRQICQIRKEFHLRSIYFYNDIIMLGLNSQLSTMLNGIFVESNRTKKSQSPRFSQEHRSTPNKYRNSGNIISRSPLQAKLHKYELQSDLIEDSSPIKDKIVNEYKPIDQRSKYFTLDKEEEELDRKLTFKEKDKAKHTKTLYQPKMLHPNHSSRTNHQQPTNNYQEPRNNYQEASDLSHNQQSYNKNRQEENKDRDKSNNKNNKNTAHRNTKELVKNLEEEENRKRLDLDKIYREAGIYRKR